MIKRIPPLFVKTRRSFNQTSTYHIAKVVRFLLLKSYLLILTYRITIVSTAPLSHTHAFFGILRWLLHAQFCYPGYEQFVNIRRTAGSTYYTYMSLYHKCPNVSIKAAHVLVQYSYPPASHYKLALVCSSRQMMT